MPDWVSIGAGRLALSSRPKYEFLRKLADYGVQRVVTLSTEADGADKIGEMIQAQGVQWSWLRLKNAKRPAGDADKMLRAAMPVLSHCLDQGESILIHCSAGLHRTGMVAYGLLRYRGYSHTRTLELIEQMRPKTRAEMTGERMAWGRRNAVETPYRMIPLFTQDARGTYCSGHAAFWNPQRVRMDFLLSEAAMARDCGTTTFATYYKELNPALELKSHEGLSVRQAVEQHPGGIAYFNVGESALMLYPVIVRGQLVCKPEGSRVLLQKDWEPLNDTFPFFLQHVDGCVEIRDIRVVSGEIHPGDVVHVRSGTDGFSVPYLVKQGEHIPLRNPPPGEPARAGETYFPADNQPAALSAIGVTADGMVVRVGLVGDVANSQDTSRLPTESDLVQHLCDLGVADALFSGGSGDVQYYDAASQTLVVAAERPKSPDKRWVLQDGQTERGLALIAMLVRRPDDIPGGNSKQRA